MDNILFCSVGRRGKLLQDFRKSMNGCGKIIGTELSPVAPALFFCDEKYLVPRIDSPDYYNHIFDICEKCDVKAITTLIDPEIELLAKRRDAFLSKGVRTVLTYNSLEGLKEGLERGEISFPVFMKPISGSGSVGIGKVNNWEEAEAKFNDGKFTYIIQELMTGGDCDADVYVDCISHKPVAIFSKKKIESRIGGASKTISFKDQKLFDFVAEVCSVLELNGPCDMDFFIKDGEYYLSEINPRFGGAYLHAYGAGVDFIKLIINNIHGIENESIVGQYDEDVIMMMYDDVVITKKSDLLSDNFSLI